MILSLINCAHTKVVKNDIIEIGVQAGRKE